MANRFTVLCVECESRPAGYTPKYDEDRWGLVIGYVEADEGHAEYCGECAAALTTDDGTPLRLLTPED